MPEVPPWRIESLSSWIGRRGGWTGAYSNHDNLGIHNPLVRVFRAGKVPPEEVYCRGVRGDFEDCGSPGNGAEPVVKDFSHDGDRHGGGSSGAC